MKIWKLVKEAEGYRVYSSEVRNPEEWDNKKGGYVLKGIEEIPELSQEGWEYTLTGGQYPELIVYDPSKIAIVWLSAREREEWEKGKLKVEGMLDWYPASVHKGWKIVRRQAILILDATKGKVYENYTIESYDPQEPTPKDIEKVESLLKSAKRVIDGDETIEKTTEPDPENPYITHIRYDKCEFCKKIQEKFNNPYTSCFVHSIYESIISTSPRKSVVVVRNEHLRDEELKRTIDRIVIQPSPSVALAVLTKEGDVLFLKKEGKPLVKLNCLKGNVFEEVLQNA